MPCNVIQCMRRSCNVYMYSHNGSMSLSVYMLAFVYSLSHTCICLLSVYECTYGGCGSISACVHLYIYIHIHPYIPTYIHTYMCMMCSYKHKHTYLPTYIHTYIHIYTDIYLFVHLCICTVLYDAHSGFRLLTCTKLESWHR